MNGYTVPAGVAAGDFLEHLRPLDATNEPPAFAANPLFLPGAFHGTIYTGQTLGDKATDPDLAWGDTLVFQKMSGPAWAYSECARPAGRWAVLRQSGHQHIYRPSD